MAFGFYLFEDVDEALVGTDEIGGAFDAFDQLAVHVLGLDEVVAVDEDHVGVGEEVVGKIVLVFEFFLGAHGVARDAEDNNAGLLEFFEGVAEAAGFDGAAGSVGARVEEEDYGLAFEVGEGDVFAVLVLEGEVFYFVVDLHVIFSVLWLRQFSRNLEVTANESSQASGQFMRRRGGLRFGLRFVVGLEIEIERHCCADEILQGCLVDFFAFVDVDGAPDISLEAGVEQTRGVLQRSSLGKG